MNIAEAKEQIRNALAIYFRTDAEGKPVIPPESQRPLFLLGPPGIGKTAVVEQTARELGVGFVSYTMTHHTRQSALGLPAIVRKKYGDTEYDITEYTMSEIIASVYDAMEETGIKRGILFLDEVNCVSETLTPAMLQFLQYKTFGRHRVPDGWAVVTAGNPAAYNKGVREFDVAMMDRLKLIRVEPDYRVWREYAAATGLHASVLSYLDVEPDSFYRVDARSGASDFVTARAWYDLGRMIRCCEDADVAVDKNLIGQYIQSDTLSEDFAAYYDLFAKYRSHYDLEAILSENGSSELLDRAKDAPFDERLALVDLLLEKTSDEAKAANGQYAMLRELQPILRGMRDGEIGATRVESELSAEARHFLSANDAGGLETLRAAYEADVEALKDSAARLGGRLERMFAFAEAAWGQGQELSALVSRVTTGEALSAFIARHGSDAYYRCSKALLFGERQREIERDLRAFEETL